MYSISLFLSLTNEAILVTRIASFVKLMKSDNILWQLRDHICRVAFNVQEYQNWESKADDSYIDIKLPIAHKDPLLYAEIQMQILIRIDVYLLSLSDVMLYLTNKFDRIYRKNICYGQSFNNSSSTLMIIHLWDVINCYHDPNVIINPTIDTHVVGSPVSVQL